MRGTPRPPLAQISTAQERRGDYGLKPTSWAPVDLADVISGDVTERPPSILQRDDGEALIYAGKITSLHGESEVGKSTIADRAAADEMNAGNAVVFVDFEDSAPAVVARFQALGVPNDVIVERLKYIRPHEPMGPAALLDLEAALTLGPTLVILDGVTEILALDGRDPNSNADIAKWLSGLPRFLASRGLAVLLIDHVVKTAESRGRYAAGAGHKLAGVDVAIGVVGVKPFGRGRDGLSILKLYKDRPGHLRRLEVNGRLAEVHFLSDPDNGLTVEVRTPRADRDSDGTWRPTVLMGRLARELERVGDGMTQRQLLDAVPGKRDAKIAALRFLVDDGHFTVEPGARNAMVYRSKRRFEGRSSDDEG